MARSLQPPGAVPPAGVTDETLLDLLAGLTPEERLRWNDRVAATIRELRHGFAAAEPHHAAGAARGQRD